MEEENPTWIKASGISRGWVYYPGPGPGSCPPNAVYRRYIWPNKYGGPPKYTLSYWVDREVLTAHYNYMAQIGWQCEQRTPPFEGLEMED